LKLKKLAHLIALIGVVGPAFAQEAAPVQDTMQRVEITGSSIKRIAKEGALPVQTVTRQEIERQGITSAEQLVATLSANGTGADNMTSNQGGDFLSGIKSHNNGASGASLRGLGSSSTLVLLNGRRIATHGLNGQSVDLNSIPLAAIQRVEILKDGASAIYGTDAIGGVINFILRKDYDGAEVTGFIDKTEQGGGDIYRTSLLVGKGKLEEDGFNVMASLTVDRNTRLSGADRDFHNGYQPARGLSPDTTGAPYANLRPAAGTAVTSNFKVNGDPTNGTYSRFNPLSQNGTCNSIPGQQQYDSVLWGNPALAKACSYDYGSKWILIQPVDRVNLVSRGSVKVNADTTAFVEVTGSHTKSRAEYTPIQVAFTYPAGGAYYQDYSNFIPTFDKTKGERLQWRCNECGSRTQETKTDAYRVLGGLEGKLAGWDYKTGISVAGSKAKTTLFDGYVFDGAFQTALGSGVINPFLTAGQTQTKAAMDLLNSVKATGPLYGGSTKLTQLDGVMSRDLFQLPAGPLAAAVGFDLRRETYRFDDSIYRTGKPLINGVGSDPALNEVKRNIAALYTELAVPVIKDMDLQLAVRSDRYSDFGTTTNPKIGLRYQPVKQVLLRASANRGFHAPDYDALYSGETVGELNNFANDPACPSATANCRDKYETRTGGNSNLKPERSKQISAGIVFSPVDTMFASIDVWKIDRTDRVVSLEATDILANYATLGKNVIRQANGEIQYIRAGYINAAGDQVRGVDLSAGINGKVAGGRWDVALDGTYIDSFRTRLIAGDPWEELVGKYNQTDLQLRWKHQLRFTYTQGPWSGTLIQNYKSGYKDEAPESLGGVSPKGFKPDVDSYTLYNLSANYAWSKTLSLTAGIKNLLNTNPPFSAHNIDEVSGAGWDGRVGDPRGRSYSFNVNYKFF
jgi:iron complex outermembrane recepter protein